MDIAIVSSTTLYDAYRCFVKDKPSQIPFFVWLLENPNSPIALPGSIDLKGHDYIHILLDRGMSLEDEAFVIGFTMGNCDQVSTIHLLIYKGLSSLLFPKPYRFNRTHLRFFDEGVRFGKKLVCKNINRFNFDAYMQWSVKDIQKKLGIV